MRRLWDGDDVVISWARIGCRSRSRGYFPYNEVSLVHICFFLGLERNFGGQPVDGWSLQSIFFLGSFGGFVRLKV